MESLMVFPEKKEDLKTVKAFLKSLDIKFQTSDYSSKFIRKIKESEKQIEKGEFITLSTKEDLWKSIQ